MSDWLVHSSGPWKKHKYKSRTGTPGNYKYIYKGGGVSKVVEEATDKIEERRENDRRREEGHQLEKEAFERGARRADRQAAATRRAQTNMQILATRSAIRKDAKNTNAKYNIQVLEEKYRARKAAKQQAADERAYRERMKEAFNLPTSGKSRAQKAQNDAASQRIAAQQAGKKWQEQQAKKRKESARDKELHSGLNAEQKKRRNDAASKARKASEKRKNDARAAEQDRIRHIETLRSERKSAITNAVRSLTKNNPSATRKKSAIKRENLNRTVIKDGRYAGMPVKSDKKKRRH